MIEFPRKLTQDLIDVGASVGVFAENVEDDVLAVLEAFGWQADELLGNLTVKQLLTQKVDIRTKKLNKRKIFAEVENKAESGI